MEDSSRIEALERRIQQLELLVNEICIQLDAPTQQPPTPRQKQIPRKERYPKAAQSS